MCVVKGCYKSIQKSNRLMQLLGKSTKRLIIGIVKKPELFESESNSELFTEFLWSVYSTTINIVV